MYKPLEPTLFSLQKFATLPPERQSEILEMITKYINHLRKAPTVATLGLPEEKAEGIRLAMAANEFGLAIIDADILSKIEDGDVVEIYDSQGRQIYRNLMFCKFSSYSLLDVAVNSWEELYERPLFSLEGIRDRVIEQFSTQVTTRPYGIEDHILKEKFIYSKVRKTFMMRMKFISPLADQITGQRIAVVSICRVKVVSQGASDQAIKILQRGS
jgi:PAS domain-containing protein